MAANMANDFPPPDGPEPAVADATLPITLSTPPALSSNPREAYFQLLQIWLKQANFVQHSSACLPLPYPYYLVGSRSQMYANGLTPIQQAASAQMAGAGQGDANQQLRMNFNRMMDPPVRNTESIYNDYRLYSLVWSH